MSSREMQKGRVFANNTCVYLTTCEDVIKGCDAIYDLIEYKADYEVKCYMIRRLMSWPDLSKVNVNYLKTMLVATKAFRDDPGIAGHRKKILEAYNNHKSFQ